MIGRACGFLLLMVACARSRAAPGLNGPEPASEDADSVFVEVLNDNYYDARVHVIYEAPVTHSAPSQATPAGPPHPCPGSRARCLLK